MKDISNRKMQKRDEARKTAQMLALAQ